MYEQLQDILNKCIEKGWKPRGSESIIRIDYRQYNDYNAEWIMIKKGTPGEVGYIVGTHDLFSKDSGLMEFVERGPMLHIIERYEIMGPMTAEEKVKYFIENAIR